ncbi:hypothetical protein HCH_02077 [Hahella chejuensis KCTC 2396]|uniref:Lipoprotein n=2 Tax=Hahella chejuensis TaxID=158327 RepID=Q2SKB6_HAHCH|nr:hypothetical protein HCH_02077 [Hahella chejuensis KCTC 2396]
MYVRNKLFLCLLFIFMVSCTQGNNNDSKVDKINMRNKVLSELNSGYRLDAMNWLDFLKCWSRKQEALLVDHDREPFLKITHSPNRMAGAREYKKDFIESSLRVSAPNSLVHFYKAFLELNGSFIEDGDFESKGFYNPSNLKELSKFGSEFEILDAEWEIESEDESYYRYGIDQDTATGRTSYLKNAIVIGKYGHSYNDLIVLYPNSKTRDGEMEAALLSFASEFRAPSFAELMRQLSILETESKDLLPPYPQEALKETCAEYLPLENVWWK